MQARRATLGIGLARRFVGRKLVIYGFKPTMEFSTRASLSKKVSQAAISITGHCGPVTSFRSTEHRCRLSRPRLERALCCLPQQARFVGNSHVGWAAIDIDYTRGIEPMQEAAKNLLLVLVTLFPIVDPLGGSPFFLALTREYSPEARRALSWRIAVNSFFLLVATYFVGTYVLAFFGISLPVVQVGGGLIVIATGWSLLKQRDDEKQDVQKTVQPQDTIRRAFYPLTLPLTVGPGSISAAITLGANAAHHHAYHPLSILAALLGLALIAVSILLCYGFADRLARILGATGMTVITQLSSFFLVCIGVQIAWNGIKELLESLTLHIG